MDFDLGLSPSTNSKRPASLVTSDLHRWICTFDLCGQSKIAGRSFVEHVGPTPSSDLLWGCPRCGATIVVARLQRGKISAACQALRHPWRRIFVLQGFDESDVASNLSAFVMVNLWDFL